MRKSIPLFLLIFLLSIFSVLAVTIKFNASDTAYNCSGGWINSSANATDDNFNTRATTTAGNAGTCTFLYPITLGFNNATANIRSSNDSIQSFSIPISCYQNSRLKIAVESSYNAVQDSIYTRCLNASGYQDIYSNGFGDATNTKDDFYEIAINITYSDEADCPDAPESPVYAFDDFSYSNSLDYCYWNNNPTKGIAPTAGQLCYNGTASSEIFNYYLNGNSLAREQPIFTEEFDLILYEDGFLEKTFQFAPSTPGSFPKAYIFDFLAYPGGTTIQYYYIENGTTNLQEICIDCFLSNETTHVKIIIYGPRASGYTILNVSSGIVQAIQPNTTAIRINSGQTYFNIPNFQTPATGGYMPQFASFDNLAGLFCLDNYILYYGLTETPGIEINETGIPYLQVGESCNQGWECLTGMCNYLHICDRKGFKAPCVNGYECQSGKCAGNYCTKPTLGQSIDQAKDDVVGDDTATNNIISFIVSIILGIGVLVVCWKMGAGATSGIAGGVVFFLSLFVFALLGWLSAFILIGMIILLLLLVFFGIIMRG